MTITINLIFEFSLVFFLRQIFVSDGHEQMSVDLKTNCICNEFGFRRIVYVFNKVGMELQSDATNTCDSCISGVGFPDANWAEHRNGTNCVSSECWLDALLDRHIQLIEALRS